LYDPKESLPVVMILTGYPVLFVVLLFAALFPFLLFTVAQIVQYKSPSDMKNSPYECGMLTYGDAKIRFDVKFYLYALLFILFDIETVFLYPWAMAFGQLGVFALVEMVLFIAILGLGLMYAWRKGALRWQ
jgi:NADH:ubiquinone oxidoreductase subunit 3 (subunit A)